MSIKNKIQLRKTHDWQQLGGDGRGSRTNESIGVKIEIKNVKTFKKPSTDDRQSFSFLLPLTINRCVTTRRAAWLPASQL
jgi:hypothetical protein